MTLCIGSASAVSAEQQDRLLSLTAAQQAVMGIQFSTVKASEGGGLLVNASVSVPPGKQVSIAAPYAGYISQLNVGIGDRVKAGDTLATFVSPAIGEARVQFTEAQTELALAEEAVTRDQLLFKEGVIAEVRLKSTLARAERARAALRAKQGERLASFLSEDSGGAGGLSASSGIFKAPVSGQLQEVPRLIGQRFEQGTPLFRIADVSALILEIGTSNPQSRYVQPGDRVTVASRNASGVVLGVSAAVDPTQSTRIRASVDTRGGLRLGETVTASIQVRTSHEGQRPMLQIPARALTTLQNHSVVFVQSANGVTVKVVEVVYNDDESAFIHAEMAPNAKVAISGVAALKALALKE